MREVEADRSTTGKDVETPQQAFRRGMRFGLKQAYDLLIVDETLGANHEALKIAIESLMGGAGRDG